MLHVQTENATIKRFNTVKQRVLGMKRMLFNVIYAPLIKHRRLQPDGKYHGDCVMLLASLPEKITTDRDDSSKEITLQLELYATLLSNIGTLETRKET